MNYEPEVWRREFSENGFVIVRDVLDFETLQCLREKFENITNNPNGLAPSLAGKLFFEHQHVKNNPQWYTGVLTPEACGDAIRQIEELPFFDRAFADLICYQPMLDVLEVLFENTEFSFNLMDGRPKVARVGNGISMGNFHRDTPFEDLTEANTIICILALDEMKGENGGTEFIRGSHKISGEEARKEIWSEIERSNFPPEEIAVSQCPAGSGIFFDTKTLHAAGHNRSEFSRRTIQIEWIGQNALPTSAVRHAYQGVKPRSRAAAFVKQIEMSFPHLYAAKNHV